MRRAGGYAVWTDPDAGTVEKDSFTCAHCNVVVFVEALADASELGGFCRACMKHVCKRCNKQGGCAPFERAIEKAEARDRLRRAAEGS